MHLRGICGPLNVRGDCLSRHGDKQVLVYKLHFVVIYSLLSEHRESIIPYYCPTKGGQQVLCPES
jgi:hypothetical protein